MIRSTKQLLLAGASALAILAGVAEANGQTLTSPGQQLYVAPVTGEYAITVLGAGGGPSLPRVWALSSRAMSLSRPARSLTSWPAARAAFPARAGAGAV